MKEFDHNGLLLAEYQAKLFEKSFELNCSSEVFFRRFLHSDLLKLLDRNNPAILSLDVNAGINDIEAQFDNRAYGKVKTSANALFWIGYIYRYISYTREHSTRFIASIFSFKQLNSVYYSFHTQDPEWCIESLLEMNNLTENVFNKNYRLKQIIKSRI